MLKFGLLFIIMGIFVQEIQSKEENPCPIWASVELDAKADSATEIITSQGTEYKENEIFTDGDSVRGCLCLKVPCLRKCCPRHQIYKIGNESAECINNTYGIKVEEEFLDDNYTLKIIDSYNIEIVSNDLKPHCKKLEKSMVGVYDYTYENGGILDDKDFLTINDYCFEYLFGEDDNCSLIFRCQPDKEESCDEIKSRIYPYFMITSLPFLVITIFIYTSVKDLCNLVGKCLSTVAGMLAVSFTLLIVVTWYKHLIPVGFVCQLTGYLVQYALLSSFFWLNVMCLDIWLVFSGNSPAHRSLTKAAEWNKFLKYGVYAWGSPLISTVIMYVAQNVIPQSSPYYPGISEDNNCIFKNNKSRLIFYYLPLTILLVLNIAFFSTTASIIQDHKNDINVLKSESTRINRIEKERLNLYFKLFLVMGIPWIWEPISYFFEQKPCLLWFALDTINLLAGLPIFIIFICKKRTLRAINSKYYPSVQFFSSSSGTDSNPNSQRQPTSSRRHRSSDKENSMKKRKKSEKEDKEVNTSTSNV